MVHETSTTTRHKAGVVRTRNIYSVILHQLATVHVLVRKMFSPAWGTTNILSGRHINLAHLSCFR